MRARQRTVAKWLAVGATISMFVVLLSGVTVTDTGSARVQRLLAPLPRRVHPRVRLDHRHRIQPPRDHQHRHDQHRRGLRQRDPLLATAHRNPRPGPTRDPLPRAPGRTRRARRALPRLVGAQRHSRAPLRHFADRLRHHPAHRRTHHQIERGSDHLRDRTVPRGVALGAWALAAHLRRRHLSAYVAHTETSLACLDWPLCRNRSSPVSPGPVGIVFSHRFSAFILTVGVVALTAWCWRQRATRDLAAGLGRHRRHPPAPVCPCGAVIVFTRLSLYSALTHGAIVTVYFGALAYICLNVLPRPLAARTAETASQQAHTPANPPIGSAQRADALTFTDPLTH
ncbi:MAG: hypothetical protein U0232_00635 [Thermomicrobiales bacterium]